MKFDIVVFGGGTSGIAAAYTASKLGLNVLLVEKSDVLGGSITQGLVVPSMKVNTAGINTEFFTDLVNFSSKYDANHTYIDGNQGWFNPELLKIVFDDMLKSVKTNILFSTTPSGICFNSSSQDFDITLKHKLLSLYINTKYIVDATAEGEIFKILNYEFQEKNEKQQAASLRFLISGVELEKFSDFLLKTDPDRNVTTVEKNEKFIHLSTACTWDKNKNWALQPYFDKAVTDGVLEYEDTAYFQVFTIPSMPSTLAVNAPRIILKDYELISDPFVYSRALTQGRERIYRLSKFMKKYFSGFENSFISHISDTLGIRESNRIKGKYTFIKDDIIHPKEFENIAFVCDYPIDIHSISKEKDVLEYTSSSYAVPIESLISINNDNLYGVGRIISADFESQAALRTQQSCFSMGEAAVKDIYKKYLSN